MLIWLAAATMLSQPTDFQASVVRVKDGDTVVVLNDRQQIDVRLEGIDCPESGQAFGGKARDAASQLAMGKTVTIQPTGTDKYGRTLANIVLPDGRNLNREMVRLGLAWWFRKYSTDESLGQLEAQARDAKRGLWADPSPIAPWDWRDKTKNKEVKATDVKIVPNGVDIAALLPNPQGRDEGNEKVIIRNRTARLVDLKGWHLRDLAGNRFRLSGWVDALGRLEITLNPPSMPLNNDGDEVLLIDATGVAVSQAVYGAAQVRSGEWIKFGEQGDK